MLRNTIFVGKSLYLFSGGEIGQAKPLMTARVETQLKSTTDSVEPALVSPVGLSRGRLSAVLLATIAVPLTAVLTLEKLVWQKMLTELVMPVGLLWFGLTSLLLAAWIYRMKWPGRVVAALWLAYTLLGCSFVGDAAISSLEDQFVQLRPLQMERFDTLIVLGGGTTSTKSSRPQVTSGGDRIVVAAQMFHAGKVQNIIVTGKNIKAMTGNDISDPADQAESLLISLGVDPGRLQKVGGRNTLEEMAILAKTLPKGGRVGLITSAWHLPRSLRRAESVGLDLIPVPADFATSEMRRSMIRWIPTYNGFKNTSVAFREYLGMAVGR